MKTPFWRWKSVELDVQEWNPVGVLEKRAWLSRKLNTWSFSGIFCLSGFQCKKQKREYFCQKLFGFWCENFSRWFWKKSLCPGNTNCIFWYSRTMGTTQQEVQQGVICSVDRGSEMAQELNCCKLQEKYGTLGCERACSQLFLKPSIISDKNSHSENWLLRFLRNTFWEIFLRAYKSLEFYLDFERKIVKTAFYFSRGTTREKKIDSKFIVIIFFGLWANLFRLVLSKLH